MSETQDSDAEPSNENDEPARVWEVSCSCGFSSKFRDHDDAKSVFDAHGSNFEDGRCGSASMDGLHAYPSGGVAPEETLPKARMANLDDVGGAEVFEG